MVSHSHSLFAVFFYCIFSLKNLNDNFQITKKTILFIDTCEVKKRFESLGRSFCWPKKRNVLLRAYIKQVKWEVLKENFTGWVRREKWMTLHRIGRQSLSSTCVRRSSGRSVLCETLHISTIYSFLCWQKGYPCFLRFLWTYWLSWTK